MSRSSVEMADEGAWREVREALRRFIAARIANKAEADDVLQDVMERAIAKLPELRDQDRFYPWIYSISRNAITDYYRRSTNKTFEDGVPEMPEALATEDGEQEPCLFTCLSPLLGRLDENYREALILADRDGLRQQDVARRLGISLTAAKSRVQRGRRQLRASFEACCRFEYDGRNNVIDAHARQTGASCQSTGRCCASPSQE